MTLYRKNKKQRVDEFEQIKPVTKKVTIQEPVYTPPPEKPKDISKVSQQDLRMLHMIFPGRNWVCRD